ncbi:hypothetical protein HG535_0E04950 [Zygotorulaspora mrakii]|uniref:Nucleolar complex protein 14 n=1 Tax=Zygotorulaspora mrakii TaxID=42260 RepID=A0A7H9B428_ZYGMR|nr:uncharacterized protein HG535_0E04950 [Zygotorulaspora mrakii]QLG73411.1 hypothetical protein HG535_0E04950 [Zygotorulaspora mrakii]
MGGSQLKNLKAALKAHDLTGQTAAKKSKKQRRQPKKYDREEHAKLIASIREEFNPFEIKTARNKRSTAGSKDGKNVTVAVGKPGISKQIGEEQRKQAFELRNAQKNKRNGFVDRRFGERNKHLSEEDRMLERFTRERQSQSKNKSNLFDLNDESDSESNNMFGSELTHLGESLSQQDDFDSGDLGLNDQGKRQYDNQLGESIEPSRKKTKAEVMKEIIAKSKFYKHERQVAQEKLKNQIEDLDENFEDIFSKLKDSESISKNHLQKSETNKVDQEYDTKVRELIMERRSVPSDRTKTEEELQKEAAEKKKMLEQQRLDRMSGILEAEDGEAKGVEDLDDQFWDREDNVDDADFNRENIDNEIAGSDDDIDLGDEKYEAKETSSSPFTDSKALDCPQNHNQLLVIVEKSSLKQQISIIRKIINAHQPKLAEGNKEKLGNFTGVLLRHILFLFRQEYSSNVQKFSEAQNSLISILKVLSEKYNHSLSKECRVITAEIQKRFKKNQFSGLDSSDLAFFSIVGILFSTSDQYHLVVTPCSILMAEFLEQLKFNSVGKLAFGAILVKISLQYQRLSKRYIPEVLFFLEKSLATFLHTSNEDMSKIVKLDSYLLGLPKKTIFSPTTPRTLELHAIHQIKDENENYKKTVFLNILESLDEVISSVWKELPAFSEISLPIQNLLEICVKRYASITLAKNILDKIQRLQKLNKHSPLTLQDHKPVSIPSHAPKFEENFNPDKKSYDPDRERSEINKMKNLIKKERKFTMKEIRKDTRFEARQKIDEQNREAGKYHAKMAHIINTINTEEGAEANKYEREKKLRSGKK